MAAAGLRDPSFVLLLLLVCATAATAVATADHLRPRFHPLGGNADGKGDVTGAILIGTTWSVWAVGEPWKLTQSQDLVRWETVPTNLGFSGTTGAIALSENGTPYAIHPCGRGYCAAVANDSSLRHWTQLGVVVDQDEQTPWLPTRGPDRPGNPPCSTALGQGPGYQYMDTVTPFKDPADQGQWHLVAPIQGCNDRPRQGRDKAQALLFTSPSLFGPGTNWTYRGVFFATNETLLPGRAPWVDMIDSDYFVLDVPTTSAGAGAVAVAGASASAGAGPAGEGQQVEQVGVFTNSWAGGPTRNCGQDCDVPIWNQVQWWTGRTLANGSFVPVRTGAMDYGQYEPAPDAPLGFDIASNGGAQYYTPKSGAGQGGKGRRVMFSWLEDGTTGAARGTANLSSNCRALPRDWSVDPADETVVQRPVPELASLRLQGPANHMVRTNVTVAGRRSGSGSSTSTSTSSARGDDSDVDAEPIWFPEVRGSQLEVRLRLRVPTGVGIEAFELLVLGTGGPTTAGATAVGVNFTSGLVYIRRQLGIAAAASSAATDTRAGPIPKLHGLDGELQLHLFVDGSVTEAFWNNRTTMSSWTYPATAANDRVGAVAMCGPGLEEEKGGDGDGEAVSCEVELKEIEVWRLEAD